jgi:hypothetical protein
MTIYHHFKTWGEHKSNRIKQGFIRTDFDYVILVDVKLDKIYDEL